MRLTKNTVVLPILFALVATLGSLAAREATASAPAAEQSAQPLNIKAADMTWSRIFPDMGERSSEITILHTDPKTGATQLMIRMPANFHVPKHWHSANETHTVVSGTFVMECDGKRETLGRGSFNFMPRKMHHEGWTTPDEGALLFITVDGPWDINWVNGTPKPEDMNGGMRP